MRRGALLALNGGMMQVTELKDRVSAMMPGLLESLDQLVAIPSVAFPGCRAEPHRMAAETLQLSRAVGFRNARLIEVPPILVLSFTTVVVGAAIGFIFF